MSGVSQEGESNVGSLPVVWLEFDVAVMIVVVVLKFRFCPLYITAE